MDSTEEGPAKAGHARTYVVSLARKKLSASVRGATAANWQQRVADAPHTVSVNPAHDSGPAVAQRRRQRWMNRSSDCSGVLKSSPTLDACHGACSMKGGGVEGNGGDGGGSCTAGGGDGDGSGGGGLVGHGLLVNTG